MAWRRALRERGARAVGRGLLDDSIRLQYDSAIVSVAEAVLLRLPKGSRRFYRRGPFSLLHFSNNPAIVRGNPSKNVIAEK